MYVKVNMRNIAEHVYVLLNKLMMLGPTTSLKQKMIIAFYLHLKQAMPNKVTSHKL